MKGILVGVGNAVVFEFVAAVVFIEVWRLVWVALP
jgi:hypothetical protein